VAWHTRFAGVYVDSPSIRRYAKHVASLGKPVFVHMIAESQSEAPWRVAHLAEQLPEAQIIVLDAFTSVDQSQWIVEVGGRSPNLIFDLSLARGGTSDIVERFIARWGADRLVFGSDYYDDTRTRFPGGLFEVRTADISDEHREMILSGNARRLLGIAPAS
jgi:predicted TIM-barrel fold metal-dependent hydrolase